jgi:hypothetical protein
MNYINTQWLTWLKGILIMLVSLVFKVIWVGGLLFFLGIVAAFTIFYYSFAAIGEALTIVSERGWDKIKFTNLRISTFFKKLKYFKARIVDFRWLAPEELTRTVKCLVRILGDRPTLWLVLARRISRLWKLGGTRFTIAYLKECRLALLAWANGAAYTPNPGVKLRLSSCGIPRIVPAGLRPTDLSTKVGIIQFRGLHTIFNLYRIMDWKGARPDFSSITSPFSGVSATLFDGEIAAVLKLFTLPKPILGYSAPWVNISAGPNHPWSLWGSAKDILGWSLSPRLLAVYCFYSWASGQRLLALWLVLVTHLLMPIALFLRARGMRFPLGRLVVLAKDGGGKRRIVGVVDYWSQWALKSLHTYLFDVLRRIPQDGTFDQLAPVKSLLEFSRLGYPSYSFDLSNATDRLPVALQEQILRLATGSWLLAWAWKLLMVSRAYSNSSAGRIKYAVGQPIGALSSWAMLAFTHHIIVQVAAYRSGWKGWFPLYALLGDDIVILTKGVADEYLSIMRYLGVPINLGKSITSERGLLEFAKRVMSPHFGDLSGVSGRELLATVRRPTQFINLLTHLIDLGFIVFPSQGLEMIKRLGMKRFLRERLLPGRLALASAYMRSRLSGASRLPSGLWPDEWYLMLHGKEVVRSAVLTTDVTWLTEKAYQDARDFRGRALEQLKSFTLLWFRLPLFKGTLGGFLSIPLLLISPAPWVQFYVLCEAVRLSEERLIKIMQDRIGIAWWWSGEPFTPDMIPAALEFVPPALPLLEPDPIMRVSASKVEAELLDYLSSVAAESLRLEVKKFWRKAPPAPKSNRLAAPSPERPSKASEM